MTHCIEPGAIRIGRYFVAVCGARVEPHEHRDVPSCEDCQKRLADEDRWLKQLLEEDPMPRLHADDLRDLEDENTDAAERATPSPVPDEDDRDEPDEDEDLVDEA